jgi:hypothetical protein
LDKHRYKILLVLAVVAVGVAVWLFRQRAPAPVPAQAPPPVTAPASAPAPEPVASQAAGVQYPVPAAAPADAAPPSIEQALTDLFGRKTLLSMFQLDDFPRRLVATVDNLGRQHAPSQLWPVNPAGGRLVVEPHGDAQAIGADNGMRYTPYVLLLETVDLHKAVDTYARLYPRFQRAYEELGYPKGYFNDRLVQVIDQLLATPHPDGPLKVHLPTINSPVQPERPWVMYEYDDPALQSLSSGQKLLLRMGPVNQRRVETKLAELRKLLTTSAAPR